MKKKLDVAAIQNELSAGSVFFKREVPTTPPPEEATSGATEENQQASKPASKQTSKEVNQNASLLAKKQASEEENQKTSLLANQQTSKEAKKQTSNNLKKVGTYLDLEVYKRMKRLGIEEDKPDYVIVQEALEAHLKSKGY